MLNIARVAFVSIALMSLAACNGDGIFSDDDGGSGGSAGSGSGTGGSGGAGGSSSTNVNLFTLGESNKLFRFTSNAPGAAQSVDITGIPTSGASPPFPIQIDFRSGNGQLYMLLSNNDLYTLDPATGVATRIGPAAVGSIVVRGFDWNPAADKLRIIGGNAENLRLNADGTLAGTDTNLAYVTGDPNVGREIGESGVAYTSGASGVTTAYILDDQQEVLARLGSPSGTPDSPNTGKLTTIGSGLGLQIGGSGAFGFDIDAVNNIGYAVDNTGAETFLLRITLSSGAAVRAGEIGSNVRLQGLTVGAPAAGGSGGSGGAGGAGGSTTLLHDGSALGPVVDPLDAMAVTPLSEAGASVILEPLADAALNPLLDALGATPPGGGGAGPLDPAQLCQVPGLGPALAEAAGATCGGGGGGSSPLDPSQLCAIPTLGPMLAEAVGGTCGGGGGGGGSSPLDPAALCAIPVLGPAIVEGAGSSCGGGGGGGANPLDPAQLCAIPAVGPQLAEAAGATCP